MDSVILRCTIHSIEAPLAEQNQFPRKFEYLTPDTAKRQMMADDQVLCIADLELIAAGRMNKFYSIDSAQQAKLMD